MEEKTNKIEKIVVNTEHELTDIVRNIHKSSAERIVLTFTEQSDLLISPVNLKVVQETANKEDKLLIAQIIQNPTGVRNSKLAGIKVIETPTRPTEEDWEEAVLLKESNTRKKVSDNKEKEVATPEVNSFEKRVNSVIDRNKQGISEKKESIEDDIIMIDSDIDQSNEEIEKPVVQEVSARKDMVNVDTPTPSRIVPPTVNLRNIPRPKINIDKKYLKLLPKLLIPFLALILLGAFAYYKFVPFVKVRIFVEAKPISIEKTFTGDSNIQTVDFDNLKIPIKTEEVSKSLSDSVTATGKAFKGEKAKGKVTLTYNNLSGCSDADPAISLSAGQKITANSGEVFVLTSGAQLTCPGIAEANVEAVNIGEEYNIGAGKSFSVTGHSGTLLSGFNSTGFSGGTKEEYTVLAQQDVDNASESLSTTAIEEVKSELRTKNVGWDIIENTIKSEVDKKSIKTDIPVGAEATTANIQLTIVGTATYYLTQDLNEKLTELLRSEAQLQNLFESSGDLELVLGDNITKTLEVDESSTEKLVKINLTAEANVKPAVDKTEIENKLKGMKWDEGLNYLSELNFAAQQTEVEFKPDSFPDFLRHFPNKQGGVLITIVELQSNTD